ncbi:Asp-tRNA(Asn)/Glu-tRNA(Gln) amidotransferase subunit GatC [Patescibacteria group bacterium]|nr:Asp-tRNA(Asn)/Glu-tRNA(Gln) amidotransferase subunit GatC [Patescibacteria group bacterium]
MEEKISKEEVKKIAKLSKIALGEEDIEEVSKDLNRILEYIEMLDEVDVKGVEPVYQSIKLENVMEEDIARDSLPIKEVLDLANKKDLVHIQVKGVFDE